MNLENSIRHRPSIKAREVRMIRDIGVYAEVCLLDKKWRRHEFTYTAEQNSSANSVDLDIEGFLGVAGDLAAVASPAA